MNKHKNLLIGLVSVLLLIITIHVAMLVNNTAESADPSNPGRATSDESTEWLQPFLSISL